MPLTPEDEQRIRKQALRGRAMQIPQADDILTLLEEIDRLRAGKFTKDEIHNFCHNLHGTVSAKEFADACAAEQTQLYGQAPDRQQIDRLKAEVASQSSTFMEWQQDNLSTWARLISDLECRAGESIRNAVDRLQRENHATLHKHDEEFRLRRIHEERAKELEKELEQAKDSMDDMAKYRDSLLSQLDKEIERLKSELAASVGRYESRWRKYQTLETELEQVKSELAESQKSGQQAAEAYQSAGEELFKVQAELEQAKERFEAHTKSVSEFLNEMYAIMVDSLADGEIKVKEVCAALLSAAKRDRELGNQLSEAKELERQLREDLSQPNLNVLVPSVTTSGTGSEAERINKARHGLCTNDYHNRYIGDLESANARLQHEVEETRGHVLSERDKFKKGNAQLREALANLVSKIKVMQPRIDAEFAFGRIYGRVYNGPTWGEEMKEADAALLPAPAPPDPSYVEAHNSACHAGSDGDCSWKECPQLRDDEPVRSGRSCPLGKLPNPEIVPPAKEKS